MAKKTATRTASATASATATKPDYPRWSVLLVDDHLNVVGETMINATLADALAEQERHNAETISFVACVVPTIDLRDVVFNRVVDDLLEWRKPENN